jgi:hypothetical protein
MDRTPKYPAISVPSVRVTRPKHGSVVLKIQFPFRGDRADRTQAQKTIEPTQSVLLYDPRMGDRQDYRDD